MLGLQALSRYRVHISSVILSTWFKAQVLYAQYSYFLFYFVFPTYALVYYIFLYSSTCFEPYCAHHQEILLYIHSIWFLMYHSSWVTVQCTGC